MVLEFFGHCIRVISFSFLAIVGGLLGWHFGNMLVIQMMGWLQ